MFAKRQLAFNLIYDRPVERNPIPRPVIRFYASDANQTTGETGSAKTSFATDSPFGKASSEMHGGSSSENTTSGSSSENQTDEPLEIVILKKAMNYVPELGFTDEAISRGVAECGLSVASKGIFQNGSFDLIDFFYKQCNSQMAEYLEKLVKEGKVTKKNELARSAILFRLSLIQPYIQHWPKAMAVMSFYPTYTAKSIENLVNMCDEVWHQLGDTSTDWNWYSKRLSLATVYKSTELFMIQDKSENFSDTVRFLDNRLDDLAKVNKVSRQATDLTQAVGAILIVFKNMLNIRT